MSIDTRGMGFICMVGEEYDLLIPADRAAVGTGISAGLFKTLIWIDGEESQKAASEILDKIREARPKPVAAYSDQPVIDWRWVPKKWSWFAIDDDGRGWLYEKSPEKRDTCWDAVAFSGCSAAAGFFNPAGWENSLQQRPGGV